MAIYVQRVSGAFEIKASSAQLKKKLFAGNLFFPSLPCLYLEFLSLVPERHPGVAEHGLLLLDLGLESHHLLITITDLLTELRQGHQFLRFTKVYYIYQYLGLHSLWEDQLKITSEPRRDLEYQNIVRIYNKNPSTQESCQKIFRKDF